MPPPSEPIRTFGVLDGLGAGRLSRGDDARPAVMGEGGGVEPRRVRPYIVALGLLWIVPAVLVLVLHLTLPDYNASGQCTGLGFGCTPTPADTVLFLGYLAALPLSSSAWWPASSSPSSAAVVTGAP